MDWRPDVHVPRDYPPLLPLGSGHDFGPGHDPGDADTLTTERLVWPAGLTDKARLELRRCAEAFENTARRLREIVGP